MIQAEQRIVIEACPREARAVYRGEIIAQSDRALMLREVGYPPRVYFPRADVRMSLSKRTEHMTHCPHKGDATYWTFSVGGDTLRNVAWGYIEPVPSMTVIAGHMSFDDPVEVEA